MARAAPHTDGPDILPSAERNLQNQTPTLNDLPAKAAKGAMAMVGTAVVVTSLTALAVTATGAHLGLNLARAAMPKKGLAGLFKGGRGRTP